MTSAHEEVEQLLRRLSVRLEELGYTHRQVEDALDWSPGTLEGIFSQPEGVKLHEVLAILATIGEPAEEFLGSL